VTHQELSSKLPLPAAAAGSPVSHAIFRVARLHRMIAGQLLRGAGLHPGQELVMMQLWDIGPQRQADLVRLLDSDAATMTRTIRRLELAGFVRRRPCATDKRAAIVESTAAGLALRAQVEQAWARLESVTTKTLGDTGSAETLRLLEVIETDLAEEAASARCPDLPTQD
jgi:DNA-binding MarR family transcriptional regulator